MTEPDDDRQTHADLLIMHLLCRWGEDIVGPNAWLCRLAWVTYIAGQPFDVDAVIAARLDYLNRPENAQLRTNLVGCVEHLRRIAEKKPLWDLPENAFDPAEWTVPNDGKTPFNPQWQITGPGTFTIEGQTP